MWTYFNMIILNNNNKTDFQPEVGRERNSEGEEDRKLS